MKPKAGFFEINKIDKPLARLMREKKTQITTNRKEGSEIIMNSIHIKRMIISDYYKRRPANKFDNSNEMNKSLGRHKLPKFIQEVDKLNSPISAKETEISKPK